MRYYVVSELSKEDIAALEHELNLRGLAASIENVFWLPVPTEFLTPIQKEHQQSCGPHVLALETSEDSVHLELLVRARNRIRCDCLGYAEANVRNYMIDFLEKILAELGIKA